MSSRSLRLAFLMGAALLPACRRARSVPVTALEALAGANRIEITTPSEPVSVVMDRDQIARVVQLIRRYRQGWTPSQNNLPRPDLLITFYKGDNLLEGVGVGRGFLALGPGYSWVQPLSEDDRRTLLEAIEVEERPGLPTPSRFREEDKEETGPLLENESSEESTADPQP